MAHIFDCPTRWGDLDAYGHLNNGVYVDFLQEARVDFLHSADFAYMLGDVPLPGVSGPNSHGILVTGHQVEYVRPVAHGDPVRIRLVVDRVGAARFTLAYDLVSRERLVARARTVLCPFDLDTGRIRRLTGAEKAWLISHAELVPPLDPLRKATIGDRRAHEYALRIRWSDLDSYRHANNVKYYDYVQEARVALIGELIEARQSPAEPPGQWVVVRQDMDYAAQIDFRREPYLVRTVVQDAGDTSVTLAAEISDPLTGTVHAAARTVLVHTTGTGATAPPRWMREAMRPKPLPSDDHRERGHA